MQTKSCADKLMCFFFIWQQHQLRNSEGNDGMFAYHAGGMMGGGSFGSPSGSMRQPQQPRKFFDSPQLQQQHGEGQQSINPMQQAYIQFALQAQQQKAHQQARMGIMMGSSKDQDARMGVLNMQEMMPMQTSNQAQASSSRPSGEQLAHGERQMGSGPQQRNETKPHPQQAGTGQLMPGNIIRPMQAPQAMQGVNNMGTNQLALSQQWQAMQAWARERNIDLSHPANANQMSHILQARMAAQQKAIEGNVASQSPAMPVSSQPVSSSAVPGENSPRANSASDFSGQSGGPAKARHANSFASTSSPRMVNPAASPFSQGRDNPMYPRHLAQPTNGMQSGNSLQTSANEAHVLDQKKRLGSSENLQMQQPRQLNAPTPNLAAPSDAGPLSNSSRQSGQGTQQAQQRSGFTKQQLHVLKAQILAFRRLKVFQLSFPHLFLLCICCWGFITAVIYGSAIHAH